MACYEGETLKERIKRGPLERDEAFEIATQVGAGARQGAFAQGSFTGTSSPRTSSSRRRAREDPRLRTREARGAGEAHEGVIDARHGRVHVPRAGPAARRWIERSRHLVARGRALRDADGEAPVQGGVRAGDDLFDFERGAGAARAASAPDAPRSSSPSDKALGEESGDRYQQRQRNGRRPRIAPRGARDAARGATAATAPAKRPRRRWFARASPPA